ncbi:hypothetical protein VZT92_010541 [Zoarces viviparus]|uniref:MABP domain-containing protein n=1 Tax=Zoarces viviparus TaxID=48416 RepID=A0AAW1F8P6_ZOAVI
MTTYISEIDVSLNDAEEQNLRKRGFKQLPGNLNKGAGENCIYLWYKEGPTAITKIQVTFNDGMTAGLNNAGYKKINKDLNAGAGCSSVYLWSYQGSGEFDTPIVEIDVTTDANNEAAKFGPGWERMACDLNRKAGGAWIHIWVKRENPNYICDITATDFYESDTEMFENHYIRVDEDTNRGAGGSDIFIWYRQTTDPKRALNDLEVSISDKEAREYQQQHYTKVNVNLNDGTRGNQVYLWYKKKGSSIPIQTIALLLTKALVDKYRKAGLTVIEKSLNVGNDGHIEYLCVYQ